MLSYFINTLYNTNVYRDLAYGRCCILKKWYKKMLTYAMSTFVTFTIYCCHRTSCIVNVEIEFLCVYIKLSLSQIYVLETQTMYMYWGEKLQLYKASKNKLLCHWIRTGRNSEAFYVLIKWIFERNWSHQVNTVFV